MALESTIGTGENILWRGRPNKKCYILEVIFNPLLPFAIIWAVIDLGVIGSLNGSMDGETGLFFAGFFALHLMPVWIYLFGAVTSFLAYRHEEYIVTDRAIYISKGVFTINYETKFFAEISRVNMHRGIFDQMLGVGDVILDTSRDGNPGNGLKICDIPDYEDVFRLVKKLQEDVYADVQYPNALRPEQNPGYRTQYTQTEIGKRK